jgi:ATP-binding cassette, sub-family E, member 1
LFQVIREILDEDDDKYVVAVEHDLSVLDYLSDFICVLYGKPGAYGVVTMPSSVREGLNIFLAGFIPSENMRFRDEELNFKVSDAADDTKRKNDRSYQYPSMVKRLGNFKLMVEAGSFNDSEILVMLGENGTGKTTFIRMLAGLIPPDEFLDGDEDADLPKFNVSYKPQKISPKFESTVRNLMHSKIREAYLHPQFTSDVMKPLRIEELMDQEVQELSGGELQRVAIALCLGKPADLYLIDEPSAYLDSEQRIITSKVIKRYIMHSKKTAFIVEHDFIMSAYLADRVIVYTVCPPLSCVQWCNGVNHTLGFSGRSCMHCVSCILIACARCCVLGHAALPISPVVVSTFAPLSQCFSTIHAGVWVVPAIQYYPRQVADPIFLTCCACCPDVAPNKQKPLCACRQPLSIRRVVVGVC